MKLLHRMFESNLRVQNNPLLIAILLTVFSLYIFRSQEVFWVSSFKYIAASLLLLIVGLIIQGGKKNNVVAISFFAFALSCLVSLFYTVNLLTGAINALFVLVTAFSIILLLNIKSSTVIPVQKGVVVIVVLYVIAVNRRRVLHWIRSSTSRLTP